ncbi:ABC transporter permease [Lachnospiraceae bacterium 46-61]
MRKRIICIIFMLCAFIIAGYFSKEYALITDFTNKNISPCIRYPFGTDWMGRNLYFRTLRGISISIFIGVISASISTIIAILFGTISAFGSEKIDAIISWLIDFMMGLPHILLLIVVSIAVGRDIKGVILSISLTHWTSLARLIRSELLQLKTSTYIQVAEKLGKSKFYIFQKHMIPHILPQCIMGWILLFPHTILHESSITFLGFGLKSNQPAIGILLSESMQHIVTGRWWLAVFPGCVLMFVVLLFYDIGKCFQKYYEQKSGV